MQRPLDINDLAFLLGMTARGVSDLVRDRFFPQPAWRTSGNVRLWTFDQVRAWVEENPDPGRPVQTLDELEQHILLQRSLRR